MNKMRKKISVCVPCYNEEKNIENMYLAISEQMATLPEYDYEILFADNASEDSSEEILRALAAKDKEHVRVIINNRNFGPTRSGINCLNRTTGDAVISIPCDFQEPPEMIPTLIKEWAKGNMVVWGQKIESNESRGMWNVRSLYYRIMKKLSRVETYDHITGFGIIDHKVIDSFKPYEDISRGVKTFVLEMGYPVKLIPYKQNERKEGKSSYSFTSYFDLAVQMIVRLSDRATRIAPLAGILCVALTLIAGIVWLALCIANVLNPTFEAVLLLMVMLICSGTLMGVGLVGEYVNQVLRYVTKVPIVVEKEIINFTE